MILTGPEIQKQYEADRIDIEPFNLERVTTNSYDLALSDRVIKYTSAILDPRIKPTFEEMIIPQEGLLMNKGDFLLGCTKERIGSDFFVPIIHGKSGTARMGLFVHVTADLIDIGSHGVSTLQLFATLPLRLYANMVIAQVSFWKPLGDIKLYNGKYQGSTGPRISETYKDFLDK
jgi:dCTP deaminase